MIRNLKVLLTAVLALGAFGALVAAGASAASFTAEGAAAGETTTTTTLKDGTGKTAHQVLDIRKEPGVGILSLTCNEVTGTGHIIGPSNIDGTVETPKLEGGGTTFPQCTLAGQSVVVENTGCNFTFTASGELHITSEFFAAPNTCKYGEKPMHVNSTVLSCKVEVGEQTVKGVVFHNLVDGTLTVEANELAFNYKATGVGCPYGEKTNGQFTTGNTIVTGENAAGVMRNLTIDTP
jgi:hypothetical protein